MEHKLTLKGGGEEAGVGVDNHPVFCGCRMGYDYIMIYINNING
jgi:hypothetical protein